MDQINELINMAQALLDSGFDVQTLINWETAAFIALLSLLGPFHYYTQNFKRLTSQNDAKALLAGEGVLMAAREEIKKAFERMKPNRPGGLAQDFAPAATYRFPAQRRTP
jgi:hypothetical protein